MYEGFEGKGKKIVVGVTLSEDDKAILAASQAFARRAGMTLRLVHVCEPWQGGAITAAYPGEYMASIASQMSVKRLVEEATKRLNNLANDLDKNITIETNVVVGIPAQGLQSDAVASRASLVMCGVRDHEHRMIPKGLSTALTLMADSPVPVMVIPDSAKISLDKNRLKILVADDLTESSRAAISIGFEMAFGLGNTEFIHLHVVNQSKQEMDEWADELVQIALERELEVDSAFSRENILEETRRELTHKMNQRFGFAKNLLESRNIYRQRLEFGKVQDKLKAIVDEEDPSFMVFGRHQILHRRPFSIGKMPFYAMLHLGRPVVVAQKAK